MFLYNCSSEGGFAAHGPAARGSCVERGIKKGRAFWRGLSSKISTSCTDAGSFFHNFFFHSYFQILECHTHFKPQSKSNSFRLRFRLLFDFGLECHMHFKPKSKSNSVGYTNRLNVVYYYYFFFHMMISCLDGFFLAFNFWGRHLRGTNGLNQIFQCHMRKQCEYIDFH